ncbi:probable E3 ubiquitin-protein ligase RHG1A isoform X2 [Lycium ferocissimum]|uniref:probable E3 ubiquitin-protein ligase RHG1A isoform X2 n=1 Tax=Lycium ferocissimum TaxID=112874 RepID=UPI002816114F|nr:probable E3 ubiquitin-protein ligase RHG1A isoform X2 [Lycium ferocissimum]
MQGQRRAIGSLSETLDFGSASISGDDQQICWNARLSDYMASSNESNISFNPASQDRQHVMGWSLGESSSTNHLGQSERKTDHGWSSGCPGPSDGSSNILALSNFEVNLNSVQMANRSSFSQGSSSNTLPHDLNTDSEFDVHHSDEDDCQIMECTPAYKSDRRGNVRMSTATTSFHPFGAGPSGTSVYLMDENDGRPGSSSDGRRLSCKRKTLEGHVGQSSGSGRTNYIPHAENSLWHSPHYMITGASVSLPTKSINLSEQRNPRPGLPIGGAISESSLGLPAESPRSTFRLRVNGSRQQDSIPSNQLPAVGNVGNVNVSSDRHPSRVFHSNSLNLMSMSAADNVSPQGQPSVVHVPSLRRSAQARWDLGPNSRTSSSSSFSASGETHSPPYQEPHSRNISQHPMFIPATDVRNLNQNPANWSLAGGNISVVGNVASTSRSGSSSRAHSSSPAWIPHRNLPQYPRRLSEFVRRPLLSSADTESGGRSGNSPPLRLISAASRALEISGNRQSSSRSTTMLERHLDGSIGVPHSWRTLTAAGEGRSRPVSEDVMILDQSVFFGMADIHDHHRDMRVDVDNMSYEELLALEERIGNVCTGLSEETILRSLKQHKYICIKKEDPVESEPCCICQEEYNDGEDLGALECGHDFHADCIRQWLKHKNLCPVCKTTGLNT